MHLQPSSRASIRSSESLPRSVGKPSTGTFDRRLLLKVKVEEDPEELRRRQTAAQEYTPAQLAQITSVADLPVPRALQWGKKSKKQQEEADQADGGGTRSSSRMNVEDMYSNLPRSLKAECLVRTKVEADPEVLKERKQIVESSRPAELAQFR